MRTSFAHVSNGIVAIGREPLVACEDSTAEHSSRLVGRPAPPLNWVACLKPRPHVTTSFAFGVGDVSAAAHAATVTVAQPHLRLGA